ncbi:helix-turn-helix transcriptional regulator [Psychrosphaera aestuarii]|uniref:helix-turn-helix transcriptional regulator n=1 Tax=Psychrosphaera aestuarii TaxID=1266052 RepID=UPI001B324FC2|nr:WYL domain-containing protein [Psychrosphaera aestuarii]
MAVSDKKVFERILAMAACVPVEPRSRTAKEILETLVAEYGGHFSVSLRTIERDLQTYSTILGLLSTDRRPSKWYFASDSKFRFLNKLPIEQALSLSLVEQQLANYLPQSVFEGLAPVFKQANDALLSADNLKAWKHKVASIPDGFVVQPDEIDEVVLSVLHDALLTNKVVKIKYDNQDKFHPIKPLGLIVRGKKLVLACRYYDYKDVRTILVHRIKAIETTNKHFDSDFNLAAFIKSDEAFVLISDTPLSLTMHVTGHVKKLLSEQQLLPNQEVTDIDGSWASIEVIIGHTLELENWILSHSDQIKVIEPEHFRNKIKKRLNIASSHYT